MDLLRMRWIFLLFAVSVLFVRSSAFTQQQLSSVSAVARSFIQQNIIGMRLKDYYHKRGYVKKFDRGKQGGIKREELAITVVLKPVYGLKSLSLPTNIRITSANLPKLSVSETNEWLYVKASGIGLGVTADYRVKWSWLYRESGSLYASVSDVSFQIPISLSQSTFLQADRSRCTDSIGRIYYRIRGGLLGWLANLLRGIVSRLLRRKLRGDICKVLAKAINRNRAKISGILSK